MVEVIVGCDGGIWLTLEAQAEKLGVQNLDFLYYWLKYYVPTFAPLYSSFSKVVQNREW